MQFRICSSLYLRFISKILAGIAIFTFGHNSFAGLVNQGSSRIENVVFSIVDLRPLDGETSYWSFDPSKLVVYQWASIFDLKTGVELDSVTQQNQVYADPSSISASASNVTATAGAGLLTVTASGMVSGSGILFDSASDLYWRTSSIKISPHTALRITFDSVVSIVGSDHFGSGIDFEGNQTFDAVGSINYVYANLELTPFRGRLIVQQKGVQDVQTAYPQAALSGAIPRANGRTRAGRAQPQ